MDRGRDRAVSSAAAPQRARVKTGSGFNELLRDLVPRLREQSTEALHRALANFSEIGDGLICIVGGHQDRASFERTDNCLMPSSKTRVARQSSSL